MPTATGTRAARGPTGPTTAGIGRGHRQAFVVLLVGMTLLVILAWIFTYAAVKVLAGGRAYVHGEGRWSKAQQEAVFFLDRYAEQGRPADLARARASLEVPLGDRQARLALQGDAYDPARARAGFLLGENSPRDIPTMIWLFEHFEHAPYFRDAIRTWSEADRDILRLRDIADRLEQQLEGGAGTPAEVTAIRTELTRADQRLRRHETAFSASLNEGLRFLEASVVGAAIGLLLLVLALALLMFRWATRRIRASEQKFWASFNHAPVGFLLLSSRHTCMEVNHTLCRLLGRARDGVLGRHVEDLLHAEDRVALGTALSRATGESHRLESRCLRADGSEVWCELHLCPLPANMASNESFIVVIKDVSEERWHRERLSWEASHDALTGLLNRAHFEQELALILDRPSAGSGDILGFIDLDHFKAINDSCGHPAGDDVLKSLAEIMRGRLRASDLLARLGGDEFGFLLRECPLDRGEIIAESLRAAVAEFEFRVQGRTFPLTASIGLLALDRPGKGVTSALEQVDRACYRAKNRGGDRVAVHSAEEDDAP